MAQITFHDQPINTSGDLPAKGAKAPAFTLTNKDLQDVGLDAFAGKKKILSIVPSLDTGVCARSAVRFNQDVANLENVVLLNISCDLPFAATRFCESNNLKNIVTLSAFRSPQFLTDYGVRIEDGPIRGLTCRAIVVLDENDNVLYTELVSETTNEPNYEAALAAVN